jgi:hypothetical protein
MATTILSLPSTMKAVVFDGLYKISVQDRPMPQIRDDRDIIIKVHAAGLCGSYGDRSRQQYVALAD